MNPDFRFSPPEPAPPVVAKAWIFHSEEATMRDPREVAAEINGAFGSQVVEVVAETATGRECVWFQEKRLTRSGQVLLLVATAGAKSALTLEKLEVRGG